MAEEKTTLEGLVPELKTILDDSIEVDISKEYLFEILMAIQKEQNRFYAVMGMSSKETMSRLMKENSENLKRLVCKYVDMQTEAYIELVKEIDRL